MNIKRFYDEGLAHASYAIHSEKEMVIIDPARNPHPYLDFAKDNKAEIKGIIETHPHADFVSSHVELSKQTGSPVYVSEKAEAQYSFKDFSNGKEFKIGKITLRALDTPGHSPDSISILCLDQAGNQRAIFTGDTLFIGDVGRPDLREDDHDLQSKREALARQMYDTTRNVLMKLDPKVTVYPCHGAGSLCGKGMSDELSSSLQLQLDENPALQPMSEDEFVAWLLEGQPFIPKYFGYNVALNKNGVRDYKESLSAIRRFDEIPDQPLSDGFIVDVRSSEDFRKGHLPESINIMDGNKFETWLGSIIDPKERFYLVADDKDALESVIQKSAKIGYEMHVVAGMIYKEVSETSAMKELELDDFKLRKSAYTIVDVRNQSEVAEGKYFQHAINIPLHELRERIDEIPLSKSIVVHCAGGYRSAAGSSIVRAAVDEATPVFDLGEDIEKFK